MNYNVRFFVEQTISSIYRAKKDLNIEIILVDNASVDDSVNYIKTRFPEVNIISNTENVGFAKANNQAITLSKGKYILLLNPDTVLEEVTLKHCFDYMEQHGQAGALGVRLIDGSGSYLPESKRGFPTVWASFCKLTGIYKLFPTSKLFNTYYLGHLDEDHIHHIDILCGAFMFMRKSVLDEVGYLDERFFMYGEDIDLSYRIQQAGYHVIYYPYTRTIHYKGESTKKGSLNYVSTFYQAMLLFANKHFQGTQKQVFIFFINIAIYLRAGIALIFATFSQIGKPIVDGITIATGFFAIKTFWAKVYYNNVYYYHDKAAHFNIFIFVLVWLFAFYINGVYERKYKFSQLATAIILGGVLNFIIYAILPEVLRSSRMILLLGFIWVVASTFAIRMIAQYLKTGQWKMNMNRDRRILILADETDAENIQNILRLSNLEKSIVGVNKPFDFFASVQYQIQMLQVLKPNEIIFGKQTIENKSIFDTMMHLGPNYSYKVLSSSGTGIIGSDSKNTQGEMYTMEVEYPLFDKVKLRQKRFFDICFCMLLLISILIVLFLLKNKIRFVRNWFQVLLGNRTWVYLHPAFLKESNIESRLHGIIYPGDAGLSNWDARQREYNMHYLKNYSVWSDIDICINSLHTLDNA